MTNRRSRRTARTAAIGFTALCCGVGALVKMPAERTGTRRASADSAAIVAIEHAWLQASDTAVLARILAPDFVHIVPGGHFLTRAEHLAWVATHPHRPDVRRRFGALAVRVYGSVAIANGIVIAGDTTGHELGRTAFTDVFVRRDGRWRAVNAQEDVVRRAGTSERDGGGASGRPTAPAVRT